MPEPDLYKIFIQRLTDLKADYFITGSITAIVYGEPRLTHDIDLVIDILSDNINNLIAAFPKELFYVPPIEILKNEIRRTERGHFNLIHYESGFKADIYLTGNDEFLKWALKNKRQIKYKDILLNVAPVEYVIIKKLEYYFEGHSDKHIKDIRSIIQNSKDLIDFDLLDTYLDRFGLKSIWNDIKGSFDQLK